MSEIKLEPYLTGIVDTFVGAELIRQSNIPHKNRLAVILLDTGFETACRAYLKHKAKIKLETAHQHRETLIKTIKGKLTTIDEQVWQSIDYYYQDIRNDFYHESAGKTITDVAYLDYKETVEFVVDTAFSIQLKNLVDIQYLTSFTTSNPDSLLEEKEFIPVTSVKEIADKVLIAVDFLKPNGFEQLNELFKKEGDKTRFDKEGFTNIVARNSGSKKYFYYDKTAKAWTLSGLGAFKLKQIQNSLKDGK